MGYRPRDYKKLHWHKVYAWLPKRIGNQFLWFREYWRKGTLIDGSGEAMGSTKIVYDNFHTDEEHFAWILADGGDEVIDETFWASPQVKAQMRSAGKIAVSKIQKIGRTQRPTKPPPPPPPPPKRIIKR